MDYEKLWIALKEMGVRQHLTVLMCNLCGGQEATVKTDMEREWFPTGKDVDKGAFYRPLYPPPPFYLHAKYTGKLI